MNAEFFSILLKTYGYGGVFLINLISSSSVIFPLPTIALIFASGSVLNPILVGLFGGLGAAIGEMTAYLVGVGGKRLIEKKWKNSMNNIRMLFAKYGGFFIIIGFSLTPFPFDIIGIFSGTIKYPPKKFFLAALIGKILLYSLVSYAGSYSINWILDMFSSFS